MNRLFWKFFIFIWLAQLTAILCIGGSLWLEHRQHQESDDAAQAATAKTLINMTTVALQYGGKPAILHLKNTLWEHRIIIVDENNHDIFDRIIHPASLSAARARIAQPAPANTPFSASTVEGADHHHYLIFLASHHNHANPDGPSGEAPFIPSEATPPAPPLMDTLSPPPLPPPPPGFNPGEDRPPFFDDNNPPPDFQPRHHPETQHAAILLAAALLVSLIFATLLAYYFSKPIAILRSAFAAIAQGDLSTRISGTMGKRRDELSDLGQNFDLMAQQFQLLFNSQRQLLHDVSHELRSPLARMQAAIGLARQQPHKVDAMLDRVDRDSTRMNQLIGELLTLSRVEANIKQSNSALPVIEMQALLNDILDNARFEAQTGDRTVDFFGNDAVSMHGNPELLIRAIENVVRNAVKHTAPGTTVRINAAIVAPDKWVLTVCDQGSGVPEAELESIFEPFFRSSTGTKNLEGYGLGLAIAKRVISAHGGGIQAFNNVDTGLCIAMSFPILPPAPNASVAC